MANCRYCDVANDDDSRELYICESCRAQKPWERKDAVKLAQSIDDEEGVELDKLPVGSKIFVKTRNSLYEFTKLSEREFEGQGGWFKEPTICGINGCTFGGSMLMPGKLRVGMRLEASFPGKLEVLTTSTMQEIEVSE